MLKKSILFWLILAPLVALNLLPFAVMFFTSVKPGAEVLSAMPSWLPSRFAWENFGEMWRTTGFAKALGNSVVVSLASTVLTLAVSIPAAYAMSRYSFRGKGKYRGFLLVTQMFSPIVLVIGLFKVVASFGMLDSIYVLIFIYSSFNIAFAVWMLQSYFSSIPMDLEEASWIEGGSRLRTVLTVFLPLAVPAVVVTSMFTFVGTWNEFVLALTLLRSTENYTLPMQVFSLVGGRWDVEWHIAMAAALVATAPVVIVFAFLQRYLVRGLTMGAVK